MFNNTPFNRQHFNIPAIMSLTSNDATIIKITENKKSLSVELNKKDELTLTIQENSFMSIKVNTSDQSNLNLQETTNLMPDLLKYDNVLISIKETSQAAYNDLMSSESLVVSEAIETSFLHHEIKSLDLLTISIAEKAGAATPIIGLDFLDIKVIEQSSLNTVFLSDEKVMIEISAISIMKGDINSSYISQVSILESSVIIKLVTSTDTCNISHYEGSLLYAELQGIEQAIIETFEKGRINLSNLMKQYSVTINPAKEHEMLINPTNQYVSKIAGDTALSEVNEFEFLVSLGGEKI